MIPLECRGLSCGYHGAPVLRQIEFALRRGETVALLGPNGSGKSTLLRTIAKILVPLAGEVRLGDEDTRGMDPLEVARRAAFVPQEESTDFPFLVREIVAMGRIPHARGLRETAEDLATVDRAMATADCSALADRPVTNLSGGERQRVLIARSLAQESPVLLLDEPTSHLDVRHQIEVVALVRQLAAEGKAVLAAVHDLNLAASLADRGILLHEGEMVLDLPMTELLQHPLLDDVYRVSFYRHVGDDGRMRVFGV